MNYIKILCLRIVLGKSYKYMVNSLNEDKRITTARMVDIVIRKDAVERRIEADWLKILARLVVK